MIKYRCPDCYNRVSRIENTVVTSGDVRVYESPFFHCLNCNKDICEEEARWEEPDIKR